MPSDRQRRRLLTAIAAVAASNRVQLWLNTALGVAFLVMIPVALITGLKQSVPFLVGISLWALVAAHWSAALAAQAALEAVKAAESVAESS